MNTNTQSGFALIIVIVVGVAIMGTVGSIGFLKYQEAQFSKTAADEQKMTDEQITKFKAEAAKKADEKKEATGDAVTEIPVETSPASTPTPTKIYPAPAPVVTPTAPTSNATAFTAANCTGHITVYVSNKSGAEASYHPPSSWQVVKTHAYGTALQAICNIGEGLAPDYVISGDAYIKTSNLSPTKP